MAYWYTIGLLTLNKDSTKFLVCEKERDDITDLYIMPGGQMEEQSAEECLKNEVKEELNCEVDLSSLKYIGEYSDAADGETDRDLVMEVYQGRLIGEPSASSEIKHIHWIGKEDANNPHVSSIIRNKIIPSLVEKGILK